MSLNIDSRLEIFPSLMGSGFLIVGVVKRASLVINAPAFLNAVIVMADDVLSFEIEFGAEPGNELEQRKISFFCEFTGAVGVTAFDGNGGIVAVFRTRCPRDFIEGHTLQDRAVKVNDKLRADVIFVFKVFPVLQSCRTRVGNVMNDDILYAPKLIARTGFAMYGQIFFRDQLRHFFVRDILCRNFKRIFGDVLGCLRGGFLGCFGGLR